MQQHFPHERQKVYQLSLEWASWVRDFVKNNNGPSPLRNRLHDLAFSIPVYLAEGLSNGHSRHHDPLEKARDSILASSAVLDVINIAEPVDPESLMEGKRFLVTMTRLLSSKIQAANTTEAIRSKLALPN